MRFLAFTLIRRQFLRCPEQHPEHRAASAMMDLKDAGEKNTPKAAAGRRLRLHGKASKQTIASLARACEWALRAALREKCACAASVMLESAERRCAAILRSGGDRVAVTGLQMDKICGLFVRVSQLRRRLPELDRLVAPMVCKRAVSSSGDVCRDPAMCVAYAQLLNRLPRSAENAGAACALLRHIPGALGTSKDDADVYVSAARLCLAPSDASPDAECRRAAASDIMRVMTLVAGARQPQVTLPQVTLESTFTDVLVVNSELDENDSFMEDAILLSVSRGNVLVDSFDTVMYSMRPGEIAYNGAMVDVIFRGESGFGAGVAREWVTEVFLQLVHRRELFEVLPTDARVLHPVIGASTREQGDWYEFAGRMCALAIRMRAPISFYLSEAAYGMMLGGLPGPDWLRELDPQLHRSCMSVMRADPDALASMELTFEADMVPGGESVAVAEHNRELYVHLAAARRCAGRAGEAAAAMAAFARGLTAMSAVPWGPDDGASAITAVTDALRSVKSRVFNDAVGGAPSLSVAAWRSATCEIAPGASAEIMRTFWDAVGSMGDEERRGVLRFWTGALSLPASPPGTVSLQLRVTPGARLPTACTCLRQLRLPGACTTPAGMLSAFAIAIQNAISIEDDDNALL